MTVRKVYRLYRLRSRLGQTIKTIADDARVYRPRQLPYEISQLADADDKTIKMALCRACLKQPGSSEERACSMSENIHSPVSAVEVPVIVWLNPFFGDIKIGNDDFENLKIYRDNADSIHGIVEMPNLGGALYERDFAEIQVKYLTFEEAIKSPQFHLMNRQRLVQIWRKYQAAIDRIGLV